MGNKYTDQKEAFEKALNAHRGGDLDTAESLYRIIITNDPAHVDAIHMLGMIAYQKGHYKQSIETIKKAIGLGIAGAAVHANLGTVYTTINQPDDAINELNRAIEINPDFVLAYNNIGSAYCKKGMDVVAIEAFRKAISLDSTFSDAYVNLGAVFLKMKKYKEARVNFQEALKHNPEHASAGHMLASLTGETSDKAPLEHVQHLFDEYSAEFDDHLIQRLGYNMPELIVEELVRLNGSDTHFDSVLDLGCGTGHVGQLLKPYTNYLTGVDISRRMLEKAKIRNIYNVLHCAEIQSFLDHSDNTFDLCTCADVFPYIGDVRSLLGAVRNHLENFAYFVFSTELAEGSGYELRKTGRYAHSKAYISKSAEEASFKVVQMRTENLRIQGNNWIAGDMVILESI